MSTHLKNVITISTAENLPTTMELLTHTGANAIEQILLDINTAITNMQFSYLAANFTAGLI